jgi:hypothetical protein
MPERLPEHNETILAANARLRVTINGGSVEIEGNRVGLKALAAICSGLADLSDEDLTTPANHYHLDEDFWGTEQGSAPLIVFCHEKMA